MSGFGNPSYESAKCPDAFLGARTRVTATPIYLPAVALTAPETVQRLRRQRPDGRTTVLTPSAFPALFDHL